MGAHIAETVARCQAVDETYGFRCELAQGHQELHKAKGCPHWGDNVRRRRT